MARRPPLSGIELSEQCVTLAGDLGFARAGVASVSEFSAESDRLQAFLDRGYAGRMEYLGSRSAEGSLLRSDLRHVFPEAQSALVVALPYTLSKAQESSLTARIAGYADRPDYHVLVRELLWELVDGICALARTPIRSRVCVDSAPVFERDLALRSGFAFLGKNTLAIAPGAGSQFVLGEVLLDLELVDPKVPSVSVGCGSCTACLDACPTEAFVGPFEMDARACISYLTIEHQGDLPERLRRAMGTWVFGCDDCQTVCPYNRSHKLPGAPPPFERLARLEAPRLVTLLELGSSEYKRLVQGTALRRVSRNQLARNAAIALGNSKSAEAIDPLARAAESHPSSMVRTHAIWALGELGHRHGHPRALDVLPALTHDPDPAVARAAGCALFPDEAS